MTRDGPLPARDEPAADRTARDSASRRTISGAPRAATVPSPVSALDLTAFKGAGQGPYLVAGVGAGMGSSTANVFGFLGVLVRRRGISAPACCRSSPLRRKRVGGNCPWTRETGSKWPRASPSGSEAAAEDRPSRRPRRLPSFRHRRRLHPPIARFLPRDGMRTALRQAVVATAKEAMGRPYRVGWHGGEWRRIRLLRPHPARLRAAWGRAAAHQPGPGERGKGDRSKHIIAPTGRPADVLELRRTGHPRGTVHRGRSLHPQREPWGASEPVERRRPLRAVVVHEVGRGAEDRGGLRR